jgi:hypothetical protein
MRLRFSRRPNAPATGRSPNVRWKPSFIWARRLWWGFPRQDPVGTLEANVRATWLLLEAARQCEADPGGFFRQGLRSVGTVTLPGALPAARQVSLQLLEKLRRPDRSNVSQTFGRPAAIVRCGNLFGGGDLDFSRLIPGVIQATLHKYAFSHSQRRRVRSRFSLRGRRRRRLPPAGRKDGRGSLNLRVKRSTLASGCGPPCSISPKKFFP